VATDATVRSNCFALFLGSGHPTTAIIISALIAIYVFFYVFSLGSSLNIETYLLKNRVTYEYIFYYYLIGEQFDKIMVSLVASACLLLSFRNKIELIIALVYVILTCGAIFANSLSLLTVTAILSFPFLVGTLLFRRYVSKSQSPRRIDTELTGNYIVLAATILGAGSMVLSILPIFFPNLNPLQIYNFAYFIFILFSITSPYLIAMLVFCVPIKILMDEIVNFVTSARKKTISSLSRIDIQRYKMSSRRVYTFLSLIVILSIVLTNIPHIPTINSDNRQIGTDTDEYVKWEALLMNSNSTLQFLSNSFVLIGGGDRPLSLMAFLGMTVVSGEELSYVTDRMPMLLGPLLVFAIFFLSRELCGNDFISLLSSFLTAVSLQTMVGLFAGYYSNWFAVIIGYFSIVFLLKYLKRSGKSNLFIFSSLLIAQLLSHAYTWTIFVLVMGIFLGVAATQKYFRRRNTAILFVVILISVAIDLTRVELTGSTGAFESESSVTPSIAGFGQFGARWSNLTETVWTYYGGLMSNFIIYSLAVYWLVRANKKQSSSIFIMTFLSIGILPLVFGGWVIQSRVLYDIPFQIPAAIGVYFMTKSPFGTRLIIPICIWLVAMSFWAVTNLAL
jgi:hypothetical protein